MIEIKDKNGIKFKFPERSCKKCINYPCIDEKAFELGCDFAKYGCINYNDQNGKSASSNL